MPRQKLTIPAYTHHKPTGQARVRIDGRDFYLGPYGSDESRIRYGELIAKAAGGLPLDPFAKGPGSDDSGCSVAELLGAFKAHAETYYVKNGRRTSEFDCFKSAMRHVRELYGLIPAAEFGPLQLKAVRAKYVELGWTRKFCNKSVNRVRLIWKWGVAGGIVPVETWQALTAVSPLKAGRTTAPDRPAREAIEEERLLKAREKLSLGDQHLFDLLRWTGARPLELVTLTAEQIDRTGEIWVADLDDHKCTHLGKSRRIYFGPKCQAILRELPQAGRLFRGHRSGFSARLKAACTAAGVEPFVPYCLRHTAATAARDAIGVEASQGLLGHASPDMTADYTRKLDGLAKRAAISLG